MDFILLALLVAMTAVSGRAVARWWKRRRFVALRREVPGYSPDRPVLLKSAKVMEEVVEAARCVCGGRVQNLGETPRLGQRVVRGRCVDCDRDVDLYFVLPQFLN
ncbi:MAG: hypothetical protein JNK82_39365 [Myxococcaceae bacterium]|nr:hypothetical protein [Myxococcaceae bacterium]